MAKLSKEENKQIKEWKKSKEGKRWKRMIDNIWEGKQRRWC